MVKEKSLAPMNIYEAVEVMKLLAYYVPAIEESNAISLLDIIGIITSKAKEWGTGISLFRMLALMYHKDIEELMEEFKGQSGAQVAAMLTIGFQVNDIHLLMNSAKALGIGQT